jgi:hypothetical protein
MARPGQTPRINREAARRAPILGALQVRRRARPSESSRISQQHSSSRTTRRGATSNADVRSPECIYCLKTADGHWRDTDEEASDVPISVILENASSCVGCQFLVGVVEDFRSQSGETRNVSSLTVRLAGDSLMHSSCLLKLEDDITGYWIAFGYNVSLPPPVESHRRK